MTGVNLGADSDPARKLNVNALRPREDHALERPGLRLKRYRAPSLYVARQVFIFAHDLVLKI